MLVGADAEVGAATPFPGAAAIRRGREGVHDRSDKRCCGGDGKGNLAVDEDDNEEP